MQNLGPMFTGENFVLIPVRGRLMVIGEGIGSLVWGKKMLEGGSQGPLAKPSTLETTSSLLAGAV